MYIKNDQRLIEFRKQFEEVALTSGFTAKEINFLSKFFNTYMSTQMMTADLLSGLNERLLSIETNMY